MRKETIIAIIFGIFFGAIVAIVLITKNKEWKMTNNKTIAPTTSVSQLKTTNINFFPLQILEPENRVIVNTDNLLIKGKVNKESLIVFQSAAKDLAIKNAKEDFSVEFPLAYGENIIVVSVYPKDTQIKAQEKKLTVYYLDEQL